MKYIKKKKKTKKECNGFSRGITLSGVLTPNLYARNLFRKCFIHPLLLFIMYYIIWLSGMEPIIT